jgi:hypothetical protein
MLGHNALRLYCMASHHGSTYLLACELDIAADNPDSVLRGQGLGGGLAGVDEPLANQRHGLALADEPRLLHRHTVDLQATQATHVVSMRQIWNSTLRTWHSTFSPRYVKDGTVSLDTTT